MPVEPISTVRVGKSCRSTGRVRMAEMAPIHVVPSGAPSAPKWPTQSDERMTGLGECKEWHERPRMGLSDCELPAGSDPISSARDDFQPC